MDEKYTELAIKIENIDARVRSNEQRINTLSGDMGKMHETQIALVKLANGVDKMADQLVDMKEDIKDVKSGQQELSEKVTTLENRPAQETKQLINDMLFKLSWLIFGGIAAYILSQMLPVIF